MPVDDRELQRIGDFVKGNLHGWLQEVVPQVMQGTQLLERMVRIEEELKTQRELMAARFDASDRRFDDVNQRFDDVNQRFEDMNRRFEDVNRRFGDQNRRFSAMQWMIGGGILLVTLLMSVYEFIT